MRLATLLLLLPWMSPGTTLIRITCGGPGDASYSGGAVWISPVLRYSSPPGAPFSYTFAVPPGNYTVTLRFVEPNKTGPNQRIFTAAINGTAVLPNLDLFAVAGLLTPYERAFPIASTGQIQIVLTAITGNAVISGIQIDSVDAPPPSVTQAATYCRGGLSSGPTFDVTGTYREEACYNDTGAPLTLSHARCYTDSGGTSTLDVQNWLGVSYLAAPITCDQKWKEGVLAGIKSGTGDAFPNLLPADDWIIFVFHSDGSPKRAGWQVRLSGQ